MKRSDVLSPYNQGRGFVSNSSLSGKFLPGGFSSKWQELDCDFISIHKNHIQLPMQISCP